jgi:DNA (cytosine-5)-methyltransferase 1
MIASRLGPISLPAPDAGPRRTVRDALQGLPPVGSLDAPPNHVSRTLKPHHKALVAAVPHDGGSRADVSDSSLLLECHRKKPHVHKDVFGRMWWDKPAPTLTCRCTDVYCGRFVHPEEDRGLSLREAASIQTFPPEYEFHASSINSAARQIGNAVPVELARRLGHVITAARRDRTVEPRLASPK